MRFVGVISVTIWLGAYCASQAKSHRINERRMRWFHLELRAVEPYLESIGDEEEKKKLKAKFGEEYFGHWRSVAEDRARASDEHIWAKAISGFEQALKSIEKFIRKIKGMSD